MHAPSISTVKEQLESYRKSRSSKRQPVPDEIILNLKTLARSMPLSRIQRELKLSESVLKRIREPRGMQDVIRLAPINVAAATETLALEITSPRGETISVRGLPSISDLAQLIRILREA